MTWVSAEFRSLSLDLFLVLALLVAGTSAQADPQRFRAGITRIRFDRDGLTSVDMPTLLYRAGGSDLKADGNIIALAAALPHPPRQETVPGGHFIFFDPCPPAVAADLPAACKDAPDVDRAAVHRRIEAEIGDFLRRNL